MNVRKLRTNRLQGFTLIELLLVLTIIGLALAIILPRAMRAQSANKYNMVRQYGSEIAGYIMTWAGNQTQAQRPDTHFTLRDFLCEDITPEEGAGVVSKRLVGKYTGHEDFNGVEKLIPRERLPQNPFNKVSYFSQENDDTEVPSGKEGLLYFAGLPDPTNEDYLNFYLIFTAAGSDEEDNQWYGDMSHKDPDKIRQGIFVARLYNDREYGGKEQ
jgi:prepilin-type N-terminal cleavage/methylation domain-containing protein